MEESPLKPEPGTPVPSPEVPEPPQLPAAEAAFSAGAPPPFTAGGTMIWSMAFWIAAGLVLFTSSTARQLLDRPETYLDRVLGRELDAAESVGHLPGWQKLVNAWDVDTPADALKEAIDTYRQFQSHGSLADSVGVHRTMAVLLREAGRTNEAQAELEKLPPGEASELGSALTSAYDRTAPARISRRAAELVRKLTPQWARDKLAWRLAVREGNPASAARLATDLERRGRHVQNHVTAIALVNFDLILIGLIVAGVWLARHRPALAQACGVTVSPWTLQDGYAVLVRGAVMGLAVAGGLTVISEVVPAVESVATVLSALPMFWLAQKHLLRPTGCAWQTAFGLRPPAAMAGGFVGVALVVLALMLMGEMALDFLTSSFQPSSLAESIPEELLFGSWGLVLRSAVDSIIWAPLVEETVFRGLLYPTLRRRLPVLAAAGLSSAIFGLAHGYSWQGFLTIFWSGFLWALAYEKTKSLWPGILCHAVSNVLATISPLLIFRW